MVLLQLPRMHQSSHSPVIRVNKVDTGECVLDQGLALFQRRHGHALECKLISASDLQNMYDAMRSSGHFSEFSDQTPVVLGSSNHGSSSSSSSELLLHTHIGVIADHPLNGDPHIQIFARSSSLQGEGLSQQSESVRLRNAWRRD